MRGDPNIQLGLPLELFDKILALVVANSKSETYSKLCLVDRSWYQPSLRHIYSTWSFEDGSLKSLLLFLERILTNPELAGFVKKSQLQWGTLARERIDDELVARLKNLKFSNFYLKHQFHDALLGYHLRSNPLERMVRATIKAILAQLPANHTLVIGAPNLSPLTFEAVLHKTKNNAGTSSFHNIREIIIYGHTPFQNSLRQRNNQGLWALETQIRELTVLPNLEKLHVLRSPIEKPKWGRSTTETMREITLVDPVFGYEWEEWLTPIRQLKSFALHYSAFFPGKRIDHGESLPSSNTLQKVLRPYHDSLESLHFVKSHLHQHNETVAIGSLRDFKKLKAISISWRILIQTYPISGFNQLVEMLPLSLTDLRIYIDAVDLPDKFYRKRDANLIINLIRQRKTDFLNFRSLDVVVFQQGPSNVEMTIAIVEGAVTRLREVCTEEGITFRFLPLAGKETFTEELPDFAGKPWNYVQGLLPEFHSVMARMVGQ
jgi:hypothetical protein